MAAVRHHVLKVVRDTWDFPQWNIKVTQQLTGVVAADAIKVGWVVPVEAMCLSQCVERLEKEWKAVGQGAIKVENDELVAHGEGGWP